MRHFYWQSRPLMARIIADDQTTIFNKVLNLFELIGWSLSGHAQVS